jgi:hypothetical protein
MAAMGYRLSHELMTLPLVELKKRTKKGLFVVVNTEKGLKSVWFPRKITRFYEYLENGRPVREVEIPKWLAERTGLL